jgi:hypothetical protein
MEILVMIWFCYEIPKKSSGFVTCDNFVIVLCLDKLVILKRMYNLLIEVCVMWNCPSMASEHEDQEWPWLYDLDESDVFFSQPKLKVVRKEKQSQQIVNPSIWTPWLQVTINTFYVL